MSSTTHVFCDICSKEIDKTEQTKGFGAISIISLHYDFKGLTATNKGLERKDFDICSDCSDNLIKYLAEETKKANKKIENIEKVEEIKT